MADKEQNTHFGFRTVGKGEKAGMVRGVFDSVASRYDVMNDLMSLGIHRLWKRFAVELAGVRRGQRVLDLASGTGDLADRFADLVGPDGLVLMTDINAVMLGVGRDRMVDRGHAGNLVYAQVDAEILPVSDDSLDLISIAFDLYSFRLLPKIGKLVARDAQSYRYLAESIRMHPDQKALKGMMEEAGFERCDVHNLTGGIVAVHRGFKI